MSQSMIDYVKGMHSDAVRGHGAGSVQATRAGKLVDAILSAPDRPVDDIVCDELVELRDRLASQPQGMRTGRANSRTRMDQFFATFAEERGWSELSEPPMIADESAPPVTEPNSATEE